MSTRVGLALAVAFGMLSLPLLAPTASSGKVRPPLCTSGGRYIIARNPRTIGKPTLRSGSIMLRSTTVALSAGCDPTPVRLTRAKGAMKKKLKGGTRVRAKWSQCTGVRGRVRLKAAIDTTCRRMWGTISTKRGKARFDAELSLCGNGVIDTGEQCDGAACTNGAVCTDSCVCDNDNIPGCTPGVDGCPTGGASSTTTTLVPGGGGGVTTTSLQNGGGGSTTTTTTPAGGSTTTTLPGDHFKCYKLRSGGSRFHPGPVSLVDQFGASASVAEEPERLCNPVDKNGEGITDPTAHLMCYDLAPEKGFLPREVVVRNQFGDQILTVVSPNSLCVPAEKDGVHSALNLNHFKCYTVAQKIGQFAQRMVTLADQYETKTMLVQKPVLVCNPVDKNGEGVVDPQGHLTCYRIIDAAGQPDFLPRDVSVSDQFTEQLVRAFRGTCRKASLLCVPSLKNPGAGTTTTTIPSASTTSSTVVTTSTTTSTVRGTTTTTSTVATTSITTSTVVTGSTTTSTVGGITTTSTSVTSSSSSPVPTTTSTSATVLTTAPSTSTSSSTTSTVGEQCCNGAAAVSFLTSNSPGDCGDILNFNGMLINNIVCAGLYTGGGGNSVPLPLGVPDLGLAVSAITACTGQTGTLGPTTSAQTGSNRTCTSTGCFFGAPLAVPNPGTPATSVCTLNLVSSGIVGTANCSTGATDAALPLRSVLYLTGDALTDPSGTITGVQPCPLCSASTCIGGPNNGMSCTAGTTAVNDSYPTSHDCPPDPSADIGTLPIGFTLSTGTVTWTANTPTNDTGAVNLQSRVFAGFCRDSDASGAFQQPAKQCWENGVAIGTPCSGTFETCEQRNQGAFGPNGGNFMTIRAIGNSMSPLGGPAPATLVSIFTIPPTFNPTVDAAGDLPSPGAVAIPGVADLCTAISPCPD